MEELSAESTRGRFVLIDKGPCRPPPPVYRNPVLGQKAPLIELLERQRVLMGFGARMVSLVTQ